MACISLRPLKEVNKAVSLSISKMQGSYRPLIPLWFLFTLAFNVFGLTGDARIDNIKYGQIGAKKSVSSL